MEYFLLIFVFMLLFFVYAKFYEYKNKKLFILSEQKKWGKRPTREYSYQEFEVISHYFKNQFDGKEFVIDDITWNDLDMDSIYFLINHCYSSVGDAYLYDLLRRPKTENAVLEERKRLSDHFRTNEKARIQIQVLFGKLGRTRNISLSDYIKNMKELELPSNIEHYLANALIVASIAIFLYNPQLGILCIIGTLIYNIVTYFRTKGQIDSYIQSVAYMIRLLKMAKAVVAVEDKHLDPYNQQLKEAVRKLKTVENLSPYITSGGLLGADPIEALLDYLRMITHIDLIFFHKIAKQIQEKESEIQKIYEILGLLESMISIASFQTMLPFYAIPELSKDKKLSLRLDHVYHPMIEEPVLNSIEEISNVLITGSNASGKSTFLKTVAINAVLSQTIYMAMAKEYRANFFRIFSSMALSDNLQGKESYFMVEIKSLKRILDQSQEAVPVLCFIDEVLRGTNTVERIAASAQILLSLKNTQVMCFAATHDIELTYILEDHYKNYHFKEEVQEEDVLFSYKLQKGRAGSRNAIRLLKVIGYEKSIVESAEEQAAEFMKSNHWRKL